MDPEIPDKLLRPELSMNVPRLGGVSIAYDIGSVVSHKALVSKRARILVVHESNHYAIDGDESTASAGRWACGCKGPNI